MIIGDFATRALYRITLRAELVASVFAQPKKCDCEEQCYQERGAWCWQQNRVLEPVGMRDNVYIEGQL